MVLIGFFAGFCFGFFNWVVFNIFMEKKLEERLNLFLGKHSLEWVSMIGKGFSSEIHIAESIDGKKFTVKIERDKSRRVGMVEKETENLKLANTIGVGPKWVDADSELRVVMYEFIEGITFLKWIDSRPERKELLVFLKELVRQAKELDRIGLDHGQLAGRGTNILIDLKTKMPVLIDFEKASANRKVHNMTMLASFLALNPKSEIKRKVWRILRD